MKLAQLLALAGLALAIAAPVFAQQQKTSDPKLREQVLELVKRFDVAWNSNDAATLAALFTDDAIEVRDTGPVYGREALEKNWEDMYRHVQMSNHLSTVDQYSPHIIGTGGSELWMNGKFSVTLKGQDFGPIEQNGYWCVILVREGDDWKARMQIWNITPTPAAPAQTNAGLNPAERQEMEAIFQKFQAAYNARDIATLRSLHAKDDIEWRSWQGPATGDAIAERFAADFLGNPGKMVNEIVARYPIGNAICEIADSDVGGWKARTVTIYVRQGGVWKAKITYVNNAIHAEPTTSQEKQ